MRIGNNHAGVDCKGLASHDPFLHAARHHRLESLAQQIALTETAVAVLGKCRMIGDVGIEPQATEPAIGQIEMDLLTQPTLRTNAEAIADDQHADHQFGIDRGPPHVAIIGPQMRPNLGQVDETVDLAQQVIVRDAPLQTEAVKQPLASHAVRPSSTESPAPSRRESAPGASIKQSFSTQLAESDRWPNGRNRLGSGRTRRGTRTRSSGRAAPSSLFCRRPSGGGGAQF